MIADDQLVGIRADIRREVHFAMATERWRRKYGVKLQDLVVEALEFYFLEHLPKTREGDESDGEARARN